MQNRTQDTNHDPSDDSEDEVLQTCLGLGFDSLNWAELEAELDVENLRFKSEAEPIFLARAGHSDSEIAAILGCDLEALTRRFGKELRRARSLMSVKAKLDLWRRAIVENDPKAIRTLAEKYLKT